MPITLLDAQTALLDYVNRPASEMAAQAKREINNALSWVQRQHEFKYTERLISVLYPANTLTMELTGACEGYPRNWLSFQELATASDTSGQLLELTSYAQIQAERGKFQRRFGSPDAEHSHQEFTSDVHARRVFLSDKGFGLYPTPVADVTLLINLHVILPRLSEDTDTNFLLDFGFDFIIDKALSRMNMFMKEDVHVPVSEEQMAKDFESLIQWDSQIRRSVDG